MMRAAVRLKRSGLQARHPHETEKIERPVREWLLAVAPSKLDAVLSRQDGG